ncbi:MAG: sulfatase [Armatimonadetes bacterium]|nr:sulfatase [Armatimonadota bacterium]
MNFVIIVSDTFRRDHLGCYGNPWIRTPHLDAFAARACVFDRACSGSFPTVPNRAELFTGRHVFTYYDWSPLPRGERVMAEMFGEAGYVTMMIADTPHPLRSGYHFDRGFAAWQWIRGQENDRYMSDPAEVTLPCAPHKLRKAETAVKQYLRNVSLRRHESDYFVAQTMTTAAHWLQRNYRRERFLLYVDAFDPHEPWDPPQWYVDLYDPGYHGEEVIYPAYGRCDYLTERELQHVRALYAGEVTLVDRWAGALLRTIESLGLLDTTCVIFLSDHGLYFGEHGFIGKGIMDDRTFKAVPLYEEVIQIPMMIRVPGMRGRHRSETLAQPVDILPTILDLAGIDRPPVVQGRSLVPALRGEPVPGRVPGRDIAVASWSVIWGPGRPSTITDGEWVLIYSGAWAEGGRRDQVIETFAVDSGFRYEMPYTDDELRPELYHLRTDPRQERNAIGDHPEVARRLHAAYVEFLEKAGTAEEVLRHRRTLVR